MEPFLSLAWRWCQLHGQPVLGPHPSRACRIKRTKEQKELAAKLSRGGLGVNVRALKDKKLKGKLGHAEKIVREAQEKAAKVSEWLLPSEGGLLEAEGANSR